eukprot:12647870-Alexandrium_andersonii.AAC.1
MGPATECAGAGTLHGRRHNTCRHSARSNCESLAQAPHGRARKGRKRKPGADPRRAGTGLW